MEAAVEVAESIWPTEFNYLAGIIFSQSSYRRRTTKDTKN
jgi:hypothetical protein